METCGSCVADYGLSTLDGGSSPVVHFAYGHCYDKPACWQRRGIDSNGLLTLEPVYYITHIHLVYHNMCSS